MKENKKKKKIEELPFDESLDLFGEHKSREQVRIEEKQRRKEERQAMAEELKRRRQEAKEGKITTRRKDVMVISAVLAGIILLCVLALFNSDRKSREEKGWTIDEDRGHCLYEDAYPAMSGDQPEAALTEAYFTENGHLCVTLLISNGTDKVMRINSLELQAFDYSGGEQGDQFAGGVVTLEEGLVIKVAGVEQCTVYIAPEHVLKGEDYVLPELVSMTIYFDSEPIELE